ncbi:acyl-CoA dehydrogenase [Mycobacterium tuberculosis]|nr:acyl-CoA dehydrogenase [Mycobacterium tuberculosis]
MAPAAISKLLSMRTGQGYAEFAVHVGGPAQHHRRAVAGPTPRPVSTRASSYSLRSSRLRTLPVGLRGSSSRKITSRGTL